MASCSFPHFLMFLCVCVCVCVCECHLFRSCLVLVSISCHVSFQIDICNLFLFPLSCMYKYSHLCIFKQLFLSYTVFILVQAAFRHSSSTITADLHFSLFSVVFLRVQFAHSLPLLPHSWCWCCRGNTPSSLSTTSAQPGRPHSPWCSLKYGLRVSES